MENDINETNKGKRIIVGSQDHGTETGDSVSRLTTQAELERSEERARNFANTVIQSHNQQTDHFNRGTESGMESIMYMTKLMLQNHGATKEATDEFLREVTSMKAYKDIMKGVPRCPNIGPECTTFEPTDALPKHDPDVSNAHGPNHNTKLQRVRLPKHMQTRKVIVRSDADRERRHQKDHLPPT